MLTTEAPQPVTSARVNSTMQMLGLLKNAVLVLLVVLMPLRGIAAAAADACAPAQAESMQAQGDHERSPHDHDATSEHCAGSSAIVATHAVPLPAPSSTDHIRRGHRFAAGFVPEQLDPPPLAS